MEDNNSPESPIMPIPEEQQKAAREMGANTNTGTEGGKRFMQQMTEPETVRAEKSNNDPSIGEINWKSEPDYKAAGKPLTPTASKN